MGPVRQRPWQWALRVMVCGSVLWTRAIWLSLWRARYTVNSCLSALWNFGKFPVDRRCAITDSRYIRDCVAHHLHMWRLQGQKYLNSDLWGQLQAEIEARTARTLCTATSTSRIMSGPVH